MRKEMILKARVGTSHRQRVQELSQQTGLNSSEIIRRLIENAAVEMRPTLGATLTVSTQNKCAPTLTEQGAFAN